MSSIVRQSQLFAGEDFTKVYKSFKDIDFTAYDFDTIRSALIDYIQVHYPEDFNDYIESSEFVAIIELLSYLGTSLAFRADINARENILDTAERRESIIRLAKMVSYQPKRNIAANGLMKIKYIKTDEQVLDATGVNLNNSQIVWNDPNNINWFDQFTSILNSAFNPTNPFGKATKSDTIGGINTEIYNLNSVTGLQVSYNLNVSVNGEEIPIDIVNPDISNEAITEKHPNQNNAFGLLYRNDNLGASSANSGFFVHFKQGKLDKYDEAFSFPESNRSWSIPATGVNNEDVYVQEINDAGDIQEEWLKVPALNGSNVIYNELNFNERNIYEVVGGLDDAINIKFADGNFGDVPTGIFRVWYRTSLGRKVVFRPEDMSDLKVTLPYYGTNGQQYRLTIAFSLENSVSNGAGAETNEEIKTRAPQVYYTQDRMINNEDYNVFPLSYGNEILKLRAINRTHSGHSRFIQTNDPTGFNDSMTVLGEDGAIYNDSETQRDTFVINDIIGSDISAQVANALQVFINNNDELTNFYHNQYLPTIDPVEFDLTNSGYWKVSPDNYRGSNGFFIQDIDEVAVPQWPYGTYTSPGYSNVHTAGGPGAGAYRFISSGATVVLSDGTTESSATILSSVSNGQPYDPSITDVGPIELSSPIKDLWRPVSVTPSFRTALSNIEVDRVVAALQSSTTFALKYNVVSDEWEIFTNTTLNTGGTYDATSTDNDWFLYVNYIPGTNSGQSSYEFISRGIVTVFESLDSVRFYWDPTEVIKDSETGQSMNDTIEILPFFNDNVSESVVWDLTGIFIQDDGFQDPAKIKVLPIDFNKDDTVDKPDSFAMLVDVNDEVLFETYIDIDGYEKTKPWISDWLDLTAYDASTVVTLDLVNSTIIFDGIIYPVLESGLFLFSDKVVIDNLMAVIQTELNSDYNSTKAFITNITDRKSFRVGVPGSDITNISQFYTISDTLVGTAYEVVAIPDLVHFSKNGISFTQNSAEDIQRSYLFKWNHFVGDSRRVDPAVTNIIDTIIMTSAYYDEIKVWKNENKSKDLIPLPPTTEELRVQFSDLTKYKSISDEMIFNSGKFKVLFGEQADPELRATFKAIKIPSSSMSDSELKTLIIQSVDTYFDISNWDFGERFYYTELAAFVHTQLSKYLSSVVIVPNQDESQFGNLFEIAANPNELFLSTASVSDVDIVTNLTETNLRM